MCPVDQRNSDPRWRDLLEARWRARVREVTELSLAYHAAAESDGDQGETKRLLHRTVAVRRDLADTEEALRRLTVGEFGRCERCSSPIPSALLVAVPESRYCPRCVAEHSAACRNDTVGLSLG